MKQLRIVFKIIAKSQIMNLYLFIQAGSEALTQICKRVEDTIAESSDSARIIFHKIISWRVLGIRITNFIQEVIEIHNFTNNAEKGNSKFILYQRNEKKMS